MISKWEIKAVTKGFNIVAAFAVAVNVRLISEGAAAVPQGCASDHVPSLSVELLIRQRCQKRGYMSPDAFQYVACACDRR